MSISYKGIEEIIKDQYAKGLLTVDFQAMLDMKTCPECEGNRLKKESLNVFLTIPSKKSDSKRYNIADLQKLPLNELIIILTTYRESSKKDTTLV
ncbi:TPA: hypothetical protein DIC40_05860 [Patescibacteria group bacterium]|nr:hypothetical protein [Candidatus Gracilibacteria bacterium]